MFVSCASQWAEKKKLRGKNWERRWSQTWTTPDRIKHSLCHPAAWIHIPFYESARESLCLRSAFPFFPSILLEVIRVKGIARGSVADDPQLGSSKGTNLSTSQTGSWQKRRWLHLKINMNDFMSPTSAGSWQNIIFAIVLCGNIYWGLLTQDVWRRCVGNALQEYQGEEFSPYYYEVL